MINFPRVLLFSGFHCKISVMSRKLKIIISHDSFFFEISASCSSSLSPHEHFPTAKSKCINKVYKNDSKSQSCGWKICLLLTTFFPIDCRLVSINSSSFKTQGKANFAWGLPLTDEPDTHSNCAEFHLWKSGSNTVHQSWYYHACVSILVPQKSSISDPLHVGVVAWHF